MALTYTDRRRLLLATALTVAALPSLWWANRSNSAAPNVATAGIAVESADPTDSGDSASPSPSAVPDSEAAAPVFLEGPSGQVGAGLSEIAVPAAPGIESIVTSGTFRNDLASSTSCTFPGLTTGMRVTILNLDNGLTTTCTTVLGASGAAEVLVMHPDLFSTIADLTDAPIPVEIRR